MPRSLNNAFLSLCFCLFLSGLFYPKLAPADVVKPALVEISIFADNTISVVIDLSLEAAMTNIGTQYKNTKNSPNAAEYDELRNLNPENLRQRFLRFAPQFLSSIRLLVNGKTQDLTLKSIKSDIKGYTKRPRKTILTYIAQPEDWAKTIQWQYAKVYGDSALRYQIVKKDQYNWSGWRWLRNGASSGTIDISLDSPNSTPTMLQTLGQFIGIGFDHVIPLGWDHILFIVGMALSSLLWRKLLLLVTTFTLAHTLTLALAMAGVVEISPRITEPLIAFSIAYVAIENLLPRQSIKRKSIIVFLFGLIHGLGFAAMLKSFAMSADNFAITLIGFNIGVELAQIVLVFSVVTVLLLLKGRGLNYQKLMIIPVSILISLLGIYWGVERII